MPFNGSGTYSPPGADFPAVTATVISSTKYNNVVNDIATALTNCVTRDGQSPLTADFATGNRSILNIASGAANAPSVRFNAGGGLYAIAAGKIGVSDGSTGAEIGFRSMPFVASSGETAAVSIRGKVYAATGTIVVPASVFTADDWFGVYNNTAGSLNITQGSGLTLRWLGTTLTGSRILAPRSMAFFSFLSTTECLMTGPGII